MRTRPRPRLPTPALSRDDYDVSPIRRAIIVLVALKVAGIIVVLDPTGLDAFHLPKSLFSRAIAWLLAALVIAVLLRYGRGAVPRTRVHLFVLAFLTANVLSALSAENAYIAVFGEREKYLGLTFLADMSVLYGAVAISFRRAADWATLAVAIALAGALSVAYAAVQGLGLDPVRWDAFADRPFGTFGNPDMLGHFLSLAFGGALGIAAFPSGRWPLAARVMAASVAAIALVAATSIATRGSLVGFVSAFAFASLIHMKFGGLRHGKFGPIVVRGLAAVALLAGVVALSPLAERARTTMEGYQVRDRIFLYQTALQALADRPLLGYGPDNFAVAHPRYRQQESVAVLGLGPETSAHGWPFQAAATLGLVGLLALLVLLSASLWSLWSRGLELLPEVAAPMLLASAAYWGHGLVAVDTISVDWWPWVVFGTAAALDGRAALTAPPYRRPHRLAAWGTVALALVASVTGATAWLSNQNALAAKLAWEAGRADAALAAASASVRFDAGRADHWNWLGLALDLEAQWRSAGDAYLEAATRAPHEAAYWSNLARSRARQALLATEGTDDGAVALAAARRAVAADPNAPEPNAVLAEVANLFGEHELALEAATHAIRLYRQESSYDLMAVEAALSLADQTAARQKLDELLLLRDSATLRVAAARIALTLSDPQGARVHARRALALEPANLEAQAILSETGG